MATTSIAATAAGVGVDVASIVSGLMTIERQPVNTIQTKINTDQGKLSAMGLIKSQIANFQSAVQGLDSSSTSSLNALTATTSDSTVFSATADGTAVAGSYAINVTTLATAQNLVAAGQTDNSTALSSGASTVTFKIGTTSTDVAIAAGATLQDISSAINSANLGVTATIINDGSATPYRLALSTNNTGLTNSISSITVNAGGDSAVNNLLAYNPTSNAPATTTMTQKVAAQNADFTVNGIQITKASNTVSDAIQGVTLTLSKQATPATLTVARDTATITTQASAFVKAYNDLNTALQTSTAYKANQSLEGDSTLRNMQVEMRNIAATAVSGGSSMSHLFDVGISFTATGTMTLDSAKLSSAMTSNFSDVSNLFNGSTGYATNFAAWTKTALAVDGTIATSTKNINSQISSLNKQVDTWNTRLTAIQANYTTLYSNLNVMLANMSQTSQYLTRQLG